MDDIIILYGIPNCDSCRKARTWLTAQGIPYRFHDIDIEGTPTKEQLADWSEAIGWVTLFNRKSTTYRSLSEEDRDGMNAEKAIGLILRYPRLLKRPVLQSPRGCIAGFDPDLYKGILHDG